MQINHDFFKEVANGKAYLPVKVQKQHSVGIAVQRRRTPMSYQLWLIPRMGVFLLAFCLMGLLPGVAVCAVSAADINIIDYGAVPNDTIHDTNAIQAAINAAGNGDRVIVPAGKFIITTIYVKSNMTLYLSEGAVLESSADWRDFSDPWNWRNAMIKGRTGNTLANFTIEGPGIIDGVDCESPDGEAGIRGPHTIYLSGYLSASSASNIRISEITIKNSGNYAIFTNNVKGVTIENVKIRGGWDGFDINHSTDITITGCDFRTSDDCIAGVGLQNVEILNSQFNSSMQGIRIGGDNVVIRDCEFWGPGEYEHRVHKTTLSRAAIHPPDWDRGQPDTPSDNWLIENCTFSNIREAFKYNKGADGFGVRRITFNNITVTPPENSDKSPIAISGEEARLIINGGDFSAGSNSPTIIDIKNFDHLELHDVTLRIDPNRPAIKALNGNMVLLDRVRLVPDSNVNPFDLTGIATLVTSSPEMQQNSISVYPNPFEDRLFISGVKKNSRVTITDVSGRIVSEHANITASQTSISLDQLKPGMYFIKIMEDKKQVTSKLLKK
jgi:hypothetical protein